MSSQTPEPTVRLINLTGKPEHVAVDGERVLLPEGPKPVVLDIGGAREGVLDVAMPDGATATVHLESVSGAGSCPTMYTPPVLDDVLYLVLPETAASFPHRIDFVCPARYTLDRDVLLGDRKIRGVLSSVRRGVPTATADSEDITAEVFED